MLRRFFKSWLPVLLWMLIIFGASSNLGSPNYTSRFIGPIVRWLIPDISREALEKIHYGVRKTSHFVEYAILAALLARGFQSENFSTATSRQLALVVLLCALYAASDEFHQHFVKGREGRVTDVLLDASGATFGALVYRAFFWRRKSA